LAEISNFLYDFFYKSVSKTFIRIQKKNYPVPDAVDFIMFNFGEFLAILYGELLLNKSAIYGVKKDEFLIWNFRKK
jgi:hypothetical protein